LKSKEWILRNLPHLLVALVIIIIVVVIRSFSLPDTKRPVVAGIVLIGSKSDSGWNESHYIGLMNACREQNCALKVHEYVPEEEAALYNAVDALIKEGANVIYLTSFGYGAFADGIADKHPDIAFFCLSGKGTAKNCTSYFARLYQVRYLAGIAAGAASRSGILGYVAAMPNAETNRSINAYALGMRAANPKAKLLVRFTGSWDHEEKERESVSLLAQKGADVITYHEDRPYAIQEAERLGLLSTGYNAVSAEHTDRFLTAALYNWDIIYGKVLGDYLSGRANLSKNYWSGLSEGGVRLYPLSALVPEKAMILIEQEKKRIMTNRDVFSGILYDNEGNIRCGEDERISDDELFHGMEWFAEGVEIYE